MRALVLLLALLPMAAQARDPEERRAFVRQHPCPATGKTYGACHGWVVDHMIPLCAGGPDSPENMQWQRRADALRKDRVERTLCQRLRHCGKDRDLHTGFIGPYNRCITGTNPCQDLATQTPASAL